MLEAEELTYKIRGCVYEVYRQLGAGFLERVYENSLVIELRCHGLNVASQHSLDVRYKNHIVGQYVADIVVEKQVLVELKAVSRLLPVHEAQVLNYLKATDIKVGLLINFSHPKASVRRLVL